MCRGDRARAIGAVVVLWLTVLFVFVQILPDTGTSAVVAALAVAGGLVLLFNYRLDHRAGTPLPRGQDPHLRPRPALRSRRNEEQQK